jgi:phytol kinase
MIPPVDIVFRFFAANMPDPVSIALGAPPAAAWAAGALFFAGWLKRHRGWPTAYTRKLFHFAIFGAAAAVHARWGTRGVCLFGAAASAVIFYALVRGDGHILYEAMAREKDAPHRTYFIVAPYLATLLGGLASNILFGSTAIFGYLVAGIGDAVAEPIGSRFGRHRYRVPSLSSVRSFRSIEGSAAVFAGSAVAALVAFAAAHGPAAGGVPAGALLTIAAASAALEAIAPHGWDNAVLQIAASALARWLLDVP